MLSLEPTQTLDLPPGSYRLERGERKDKIFIGCPHCEGEFQLAPHFMVGAAGLVNPEVLCPLYGCGRRYSAKLAKWKARTT